MRAELKVVNGALGLRAVECIGRYLYCAEAIFLRPGGMIFYEAPFMCLSDLFDTTSVAVANTRTTQPAVTIRHLGQVLLVIVFRIVEVR